jgi:hypothetical protein
MAEERIANLNPGAASKRKSVLALDEVARDLAHPNAVRHERDSDNL